MYQLIYVHMSQGSLKSNVHILNPIFYVTCTYIVFNGPNWYYKSMMVLPLYLYHVINPGKTVYAFPVICLNAFDFAIRNPFWLFKIWQIRRKYPMINLVGKLLNILTRWRKILMCFLTGDASSIFQTFFIPGEWMF